MTNALRWSSGLALVVLATACSSGSSKPASKGSISAQTVAPTSGTQAATGMRISSRIFANGDPIPKQYTCDGRGAIPELHFSAVPEGTQALRLVVHDPDAPIKGGFTHWTVTGIPPATGTMPPIPARAKEVVKWRPPCPPPGSAPHRYRFTLSALSPQNVVLAQAVLVGTYHR